MRVPSVHVLGFTSENRGGNAAGMVMPVDGETLSDAQRVAVAASLGFSETCFISSIKKMPGGKCDVALRYFTPTDEVELCGHATVACIGHLHSRNLLHGARGGTLHTRAGAVAFSIRQTRATPVALADDTFVLDAEGQFAALGAVDGGSPRRREHEAIYMQQLPVSIDTPLTDELIVELERALFPAAGAAAQGDHASGLDLSWPPRVASTGLRDLLVQIHPSKLYGMAPDFNRVAEVRASLQRALRRVPCPSMIAHTRVCA